MRKLVTATAVVVLSAAALLPACAQDDDGRPHRSPSTVVLDATVPVVADTTISQVAQDGELSAATTLATCPVLCENNPAGQRDAHLQFSVDQLPPDATGVTAKLRIYAWHDAGARMLTRTVPGDLQAARIAGGGSFQAVDGVKAGFNELPVSIDRNGTYTVLLSQKNFDSRVYWASLENPRPELRPQLMLSYHATWKLAWADEFTGSTLDAGKWNLRNGEARDVDLGCNVDSPENTFVSGGLLTLRALRKPVPCGSQTRQFTQSYLDTMGKASWTYGRFEIRAKSPTTPTGSTGIWPAFWLRPDDGGNGEIDVTELPGGTAWHSQATASIFWDYTPVKQDLRVTLPGGGTPADGFHTYATEWSATSLKWYYDGQLVWTRDRTTTPWYDKAFTKPYNLRLNMQVGGWLGTPDAATVFPADFLVDWVRVYQQPS
ncbi:family 16 glycosylhydrolase [Actinoplanes sp. TFC3]|uniref:glycoside hydrolase family 16 protein n=1 Tax=Actinoplanes sp. TFC3 TaxID=1710355 RepID=UPI00082DF4A8|nr:glycoside hydrolase family 16 protein [Actinoplanes sp. TFC3]